MKGDNGDNSLRTLQAKCLCHLSWSTTQHTWGKPMASEAKPIWKPPKVNNLKGQCKSTLVDDQISLWDSIRHEALTQRETDHTEIVSLVLWFSLLGDHRSCKRAQLFWLEATNSIKAKMRRRASKALNKAQGSADIVNKLSVHPRSIFLRNCCMTVSNSVWPEAASVTWPWGTLAPTIKVA